MFFFLFYLNRWTLRFLQALWIKYFIKFHIFNISPLSLSLFSSLIRTAAHVSINVRRRRLLSRKYFWVVLKVARYFFTDFLLHKSICVKARQCMQKSNNMTFLFTVCELWQLTNPPRLNTRVGCEFYIQRLPLKQAAIRLLNSCIIFHISYP